MRYTIQDVAKAAGVSSRTLRHYDAIGLLPAQRDANGYRTYGERELVRLQRILLLRELGLTLPAIGNVLDETIDDATALRDHLGQLRHEADRIRRQIASVERTIANLENEEAPMAENMFDGFDNSQYREEVEQRWGKHAWAEADQWWSGLAETDQRSFQDEHTEIAAQWAAAKEAGLPPDSVEAQQIAARHTAWITAGWQGKRPTPEALRGLAQMYVDDERFAANYGGVEGARYVRDALVLHSASLSG